MGILLGDDDCFNIPDRIRIDPAVCCAGHKHRAVFILLLSPAPALLHGLDLHGNPVGNFFLQASERLLTDDLRSDAALCLVRDRLLIIVHRAFRKMRKDRFKHAVYIDAAKRTDRDDLFERIQLPVHFHVLRELRSVDRIHLVHHKDHRLPGKFQSGCDELLPGPAEGGRLDQPQDHIHLGKCLQSHVIHVFAQLVLRLVNTRCIQKHDLSLFTGVDRTDLAAGRLRFAAGDCYLLTDQMIHEGGLADIRSSHDPHKS